tara:strand:- start:3038 stop:4924 length:1887 start_codon:yes stop_codon:yes gene_type:complete
MAKNLKMVLLEKDLELQGNSKIIAHWSEINVPPKHISIPTKVEEEISILKNEYLSWVYELGQSKVGGKTITKHLQIMNNLSFWWMTYLSEKSPYKCPGIYRVFKLRILEKLYLKNNCRSLIFYGQDPLLNQVLSQWCKKMGHSYQQITTQKKIKRPTKNLLSMKKLFSNLPYFFQSCIWLIGKWWNRFRHLKTNPIIPDSDKNQVTLVTFFPNIDKEKAEKGMFYSRYWEELHLLLDNLPFKVNWVWFYFKQSEINFKTAIKLRDKFNLNQPEKYRYYLLDEFISFDVLLLAIRLYSKIFFKGHSLKELKKAFKFPGSELNFYPFLKEDWDASFFGALARDEALRIAQFDLMAAKLGSGPWSMFTWENQGWELGLISAWKRQQKKMLIFGHAHSSVRPLDLCMLSDPNTYKDFGDNSQPLPDHLAVGTLPGINFLKQSGYPKDRLFEVEALRYSHLRGRYGSEKKELKSSSRVLLIAPGMTNHETKVHFNMLVLASKLGGLDKYQKVILKQHPGYPLDEFLEDFDLPFTYSITKENLDNLWSKVDVVYCPNSPGVSLEAVYLGIPIIIPGPIDSLNMSPLYKIPELEFSTSIELLVENLNNPNVVNISEDYFFFDKNLQRWKTLLNIK